MPDPWEHYRQLVMDEGAAYRVELAARSPEHAFDARPGDAMAALNARFDALQPRLSTGGAGDEGLPGELASMLGEYEALLDQYAADSRLRRHPQVRCNQVMTLLAQVSLRQEHPDQARDWLVRAAEGWRVLDDQAAADEALRGAAEASLAGGEDPDRVVEALDALLGGRPPVRTAVIQLSAARVLLHAGDVASAGQRAGQAEAALNAAGFTDPCATGSVEDAFAAWVRCAHREPLPRGPLPQVTTLMHKVAQTWAALINLRFRLGTMPISRAQPPANELFALAHRILSEVTPAGGVGAGPGHGAGTKSLARTVEESRDRVQRLSGLQEEIERTPRGQVVGDELMGRLAALETEAALAGDAMAAATAAVRRADALLHNDRSAEVTPVIETARRRLGRGDGLQPARRQAMQVQLIRRAALATVLQGRPEELSRLCGDAIAEFEQERTGVNEPYLQDAYLRERALLYQLGVTAAWQLGDHELALARADLVKARGSLACTAGEGTPGDEPADLAIASLRAEWRRLADGRRDRETIARRRAVWSQLMTAQARLRRAAPPPPLRLRAIQDALDPDEALVYYYFTFDETVLIYLITSTAVAVEPRFLREVRGELGKIADDIQELDSEQAWLEVDIPSLGQHLLPRDNSGLLSDKRRLLICPHRILHHLPLHALDWHRAPLIERFAVSYVPNAASLLVTRPAAATPAVLAVGIDSFPSPLPDLPGAEQEARNIAALYRRHESPVTLLLGPDATSPRFERLRADGDLARFSVMHLVTHGKQHPAEEPYEAALILSDGSLEAMDISQWRLNADLVVLSACWSGRRPTHGRAFGGDPRKPAPAGEAEELFGDEMYGLQAALFAAGARQVLGSMWPLDNSSAPDAVSAFHAGVVRHAPPETALATAVNDLRQQGLSYYHWAPYKLVTLGRRTAPGVAGNAVSPAFP